MSQNLQLDPQKKDYVVVNGSPIASDRVFEACYYALLIPQNNWLYGQPGQGSLLYTLQNTKRTNSLEQLVASYSNNAIKSQVIAAGIATDVQTRNIQATPNGTLNETDVIPSQTQISNQFNFNSV